MKKMIFNLDFYFNLFFSASFGVQFCNMKYSVSIDFPVYGCEGKILI